MKYEYEYIKQDIEKALSTRKHKFGCVGCQGEGIERSLVIHKLEFRGIWTTDGFVFRVKWHVICIELLGIEWLGGRVIKKGDENVCCECGWCWISIELKHGRERLRRVVAWTSLPYWRCEPQRLLIVSLLLCRSSHLISLSFAENRSIRVWRKRCRWHGTHR